MSEPTPRRARLRGRWMVATATATAIGCSGPAAGPTAPTTGTPPGAPVALQVQCPPSLLVWERGPCVALTGGGPVMPVWSVTPADVAEIDDLGRLTGRADGVATVRAVLSGTAATATVAVKAEDGLRLAARLSQGDGTAGSPGTMGFSGYYAVVSAATGELSVEVRAGGGRLVSVAQRPVTRGGGFFVLETSFTYPDTAEVCVFAILRAGATRVEAPDDSSSYNCDRLRR